MAIARGAAPPADAALLAASAGGDEAAFAALYDRHSARLFRYLLRLVGQREAAEDLLQEVFVAAWDGAARFRGQASVVTWLFRIAHHRAVDWLRAQRPEPAEADEMLAATDCPPEEAFAALGAERLRAALAHLSPDHRAVLELAFFEGLSCREIALVLDCPVGTVKSRIFHAKSNLRGALERLEVTPPQPSPLAGRE